jgi:fatty acid desaturase
MSIDAVRTLGAHRYVGNDDTMSVVEQMLDTINYDRHRWVAELWGPVGLRLHALHHLMPALPYHALPAAHRRLVAALPVDSAYRLTESPGLVASLVDLWRVAGRGDPDARAPLPVGAGAVRPSGLGVRGVPASGS